MPFRAQAGNAAISGITHFGHHCSAAGLHAATEPFDLAAAVFDLFVCGMSRTRSKNTASKELIFEVAPQQQEGPVPLSLHFPMAVEKRKE